MKALRNLKASYARRKINGVESNANYIFQIREYNGKIWLTCNDVLVCPTELFKDDPISVLSQIRKFYIERNCSQDGERED